MSEQDFGEILSVSLDKIRSMADAETVVGHPICAPGGLTVIPVSRISMGLATGGLGTPAKKENAHNFGAGGGTGMNITPIAFLMISGDGSSELLPGRDPDEKDTVGQVTDLIEKSPEILRKIKQVFSKKKPKDPPPEEVSPA